MSEQLRTNVWLRLLLGIGVLLIPAVATFLVIYVYHDARLTDFTAHYFPLDDRTYWRMIDTFSTVGFDGGYYVDDELIAPASFMHFDAHGPLFVMIYGTLGRLVGWESHTPVVFNLLFITLALAILIAGLRLDTHQLLALGALIATSWPVLIYIMTGMQESLHQSFAILLAMVFWLALKHRDTLAPPVRYGVLAFIFFIALIRITWIFLAWPFLLLTVDRLTPRTILIASLKTVVLIGVVWMLTTGYLYAPYPLYVTDQLAEQVPEAFRQDGVLAALETGVTLITDNIAANIDFFDTGTSLEARHRWQMLGLIAICAAWLGLAWRGARAKAESPSPTQPSPLPEAALHTYNLAFIFAINFVIYWMSGWRDYRMFTPHVLLTGVLLVATSRYRLIALVIVVNLVGIIPFKNHYLARTGVYLSHDRNEAAIFEAATQDVLVYHAEESNAWCNTLLLNHMRTDSVAPMGIPPGIGMAYFTVAEVLDTPLKSRYVLLRESDYQILRDTTRLEFLVTTNIGDLYLNLDTDCTLGPG